MQMAKSTLRSRSAEKTDETDIPSGLFNVGRQELLRKWAVGHGDRQVSQEISSHNPAMVAGIRGKTVSQERQGENMNRPAKTPICFPLGELLATPGALAALDRAEQSFIVFLIRHARNDWGEVCPEDWQLNDEALKDGSRLMSVYRTAKGERIWVITEADRSCTTLLLPDEY